MNAVAVTSEQDALRRYAGFLARFAAAPMAAVWVVGREPELFTYNRGARQRIEERRESLKALCASITGGQCLVSIENRHETTHVDLADLFANLGVALLAHPVLLAGKPIGCVLVIDDVARGWFSDDVSSIMEVAAAVGTQVALRIEMERTEEAYAVLEREYASVVSRLGQ